MSCLRPSGTPHTNTWVGEGRSGRPRTLSCEIYGVGPFGEGSSQVTTVQTAKQSLLSRGGVPGDVGGGAPHIRGGFPEPQGPSRPQGSSESERQDHSAAILAHSPQLAASRAPSPSIAMRASLFGKLLAKHPDIAAAYHEQPPTKMQKVEPMEQLPCDQVAI